MAVHGEKRTTGTRRFTNAAVATASLLLAGCTALAHTSGAPSSGAAPSSSMPPSTSTTTDVSPVSLPVDGPPVLPDLVAPPLPSLWYPFTDEHTHIRFRLPHAPVRRTWHGTTPTGGREVVWQYGDLYGLAPGHARIGITVQPFVRTGAYRSNQGEISYLQSLVRNHGYRHVAVSDVRSESVQSHPAVSWAISGRSSKTGYWVYNRLVLVRGTDWGLVLTTGVMGGKSGVTAGERRDTTRVLTYVLRGLDLSGAG